MLHALESRRLLSAALEDGRLHVVGTGGDDRIVVNVNVSSDLQTLTYRVHVNREETVFAPARRQSDIHAPA